MKEPILSVEGVSYRFPPAPALIDNLSFEVEANEFVSLLGPSGTGKSTVFRLLSGLLEPDSGGITLRGRAGTAIAGPPAAGGATGSAPAQASAGRQAARSGAAAAPPAGLLGRVGYMPQNAALLPWRTVLQNAALALELKGVPRREAERRVRELLPAFGLAGTEGRLPHELSGGMRQRVAFLRAVLGGTELLLLDEPFSALDAMTRVGMQEWLLAMWEKHRQTVLFITHDIEEALLLSDRVLLVEETPIRRLHEVRVPLPRPRTYETTLDPAFVELKKQVLQRLRGTGPDGVGSGSQPVRSGTEGGEDR
ncbi:ABC transporter ATP-binding protein [Paenibacillus aurantius]|uniref:ABC transporter ATP-binding protein n=1 Tax=Paenibacillus aurantius TaxID=2918900 RepID=A0AA96LGH5_9BACL|nr:ABC transporter ATP-binding protein [Paenibacillus aurantius]WNQ12848.1 ABC transporter ATP-binding protein [Paenibacillus aurantius]